MKSIFSDKKIVFAFVAALATALILVLLLRSNRPSPKTMGRILADFYTADALLLEHNVLSDTDRFQEDAYHTILSHYGLSKADYDSAIAWYSRHPVEFAEAYERTVAILTERDMRASQYAEAEDSIERVLSHIIDSITTKFGTWPFSIKFPIKPEDAQMAHVSHLPDNIGELSYSFPVDSIRGGDMILRGKYSFVKSISPSDDLPLNMLRVHYADGSADSVSSKIETFRKVTTRESETILHVSPDKPVVSLDVVLLRVGLIDDVCGTLTGVSLCHMPYNPADSVHNDFIITSLFSY
ncbi:MAG: DUF4296 domain-containing protein [Bacteroidales bacterium]|nr:DUF4296 domain-containing protein [Bacteroidales bacterium]